MKIVTTYITITLLSALAAGCSSSASNEATDPVAPNAVAMQFGTPSIGTVESRATESLTTDFLVSAYKSYKTSAQQTVMNQYQAKYSVNAWNNSSHWETAGGTSDGFYQQQYIKYWDLSAFPYDFLAIAPAPIKDGKIMDGYSATDKKVELKQSIQAQTVTDGAVIPSAPTSEYLLAQTQRQTNADDATTTDNIDMLTDKTIGSTGDSPTKTVTLPFHHLSSKVRFGIYTTMPTVETQSVKITNVSFKVLSGNSDGFVTSAQNYAVDLTQSGVNNAFDGTFGGKTYETGTRQLLSFSGPSDDKFTDAYLEKHEWNSTTDLNAYYFECKDGLIQVPQDNVQLYVSFTLQPTTGAAYTVTDYPLRIAKSDGTMANQHTWRPNCLYTYYIKITQLFSYDISFTATVSDWEDIEGKISTNLEE